MECNAFIFHGPGHQSRTRCRVKGEHTVHEAVYGSMRQFAEWEGDESMTGFFDEPPPDRELCDEMAAFEAREATYTAWEIIDGGEG